MTISFAYAHGIKAYMGRGGKTHVLIA